MDSTIRRIIGEKEDSGQDDLKKKRKGDEKSAVPKSDLQNAEPEDTQTEELANLWTMGNKDDVVSRFMEMDNETSVKLVFAIGREGALELARMVDQQIKQTPEEGVEGGEPAEEVPTEPERIEPPEDHTVKEIIGRPHVMPP